MEMASGMDSLIETDGAEPDQSPAEVEALAGSASPEVVDVELQQQQPQQQRQVKRIVGEDGSELVVLTAAEYDEMAKRPHVADWLYDQLNDERRQRLDVSEKYRSCSEALVRENRLATRYRQLLIKHRLQLEPTVDSAADDVVVTELPEAFFDDDRSGGEGDELMGRGATGTTESVQTAEKEEVSPPETEMTRQISGRGRQSVLESDEAVAICPAVSGDAGMAFPHGQRKSSSGAGGKVVAAAADDLRDKSRRRRQLLDEASDAMEPVTTTTASSTTSRDLLQKVLEQNARLKQLMRKIVDTQGMTIREFLERSDYAELVEKLQKEIDQLRSQVKDQRQQLVADDTKLMATCAQLTDKAQRLEHSSAVKQTLIDVYSAECARLQSQVKKLSVGDVACSNEGSQHHQQQQQKEPLVSHDSASAVNIQKLSQDFVELRKRYSESERLYRSRLSELESLLCQRTNRLKQLETDNKTLENKLKTVVQQIYYAAATEETNTEPKTTAKLAGCGQSRRLDRPWMTSLPQTELTVDADIVEQPPARAALPGNGKQQQQQQQQLGDDDDAGDIKPSGIEPVIGPDGSAPAPTPHVDDGDGGGGSKDGEDDVDGKTNPATAAFTCARCYREFSDQTRYETHCKKCRDD